MLMASLEKLSESLNGILEITTDGVAVLDKTRLQDESISQLVYNAVFNDESEVQKSCRWIIWEAARALSIYPSSIQGLYEARGRGEYQDVTVPAINIRGLSYEVSRAVFRAALKNKVGALIFEIARSEIGYTEQRPEEYATVVLAAASREGFQGALFIQGDHFQVNAKKYSEDPDDEVNKVKALIQEAVAAGFYNIDIDTSTVVDISLPTIKEQQRLNYELAAELTAHVRECEPQGCTISVGGEIGEVGKKNSTVEELNAFMEGYREKLAEKNKDLKGISKISVQTGTSHGGVPLPDGGVAKVKLDFDTLTTLSRAAREQYGLSGAVQHGASTLPDEAFHKFPETQTAEVHLATGFQNMIYENSDFPSELLQEIYQYLKEHCKNEWKEGQTEEQFIYKTRKKGFGPYKKKMWDIPEERRKVIGTALEQKFEFLFKQLNVCNTRSLVDTHVQSCGTKKKPPPRLSDIMGSCSARWAVEKKVSDQHQ